MPSRCTSLLSLYCPLSSWGEGATWLHRPDLSDRQPPGQLHVVNGLPSSIYSTTNTSISPITAHAHRPLVSISTSFTPGLADAETPILAARAGYFDALPSSSGSSPSVSGAATSSPALAPSALASGAGLRTPTSPLPNPYDTPPKVTRPLQIRKKSLPPAAGGGGASVLLAIQQELSTRGRMSATAIPPAPAGSTKEKPQPGEHDVKPSPNADAKGRRPSIPIKRKPVPAPPMSEAVLPFRVIKPSLTTLEKATSVALYFEALYHSLQPSATDNYLVNRARRQADLESSFHAPENRFMSEGEKRYRRQELSKEENRILRERRRRVDVQAFEMGRVIGHGAFGVVRIAREKQSGRLVAMKQVRQVLLAYSAPGRWYKLMLI